MRRFFYDAQLLSSTVSPSHLSALQKSVLNSRHSEVADGLEATVDNSINTDAQTDPQTDTRIKTIYSLKDLAENTVINLPETVHHHWCRVLRANIGDQSIIFDGLGGESVIELIDINKKTATAKIISQYDGDNTPNFLSTIALVMSRGDRMDYAIQKSTELGATAIQLLTSQHGEVRLKTNQIDKKLNHWQQVAISACEQCGMNRPPLLLSPLSIDEYLGGTLGSAHASVDHLYHSPFYQSLLQQNSLKLVLAVPSKQDELTINVDLSIRNHFNNGSENTSNLPSFQILIGAEGGLSEQEYSTAREAGWLPWQLGQRVLRTETAPVVALSTLMYISSLNSLTPA